MARILAALAMVTAMGSAAWGQDVAFEDPKLRDADDGTWFGGVQVRVPLTPNLAIEGSIEFHASEFADGDIEVVQYPVQASLLVFLMPDAPVCPYVLAGLGWYYTTTEFSGSLSGVDSETDSLVGAHIGFGAKFALGGATASADLRYIFLEPDNDNLNDEDFDSIQLVLSLSFPF